MEAITNVIRRNPMFAANKAKLVEQVCEKSANLKSYKSYVDMSYEDFKELIGQNAFSIMMQRSVTHAYIIDECNGPVIKQLYLYFTNSPECAWNLNAGLIFAGKVGCGKSLLMMAYLKVSDEYSRKITTSVHSKALAGLIKQSSIEEYSRRPLFIDELGREESEVKDYGNVVKPVIDLFSIRYEYGARTYATTNYNYTSLEGFYSPFIRSRMEEMMTFIPMPGESRRLKNNSK